MWSNERFAKYVQAKRIQQASHCSGLGIFQAKRVQFLNISTAFSCFDRMDDTSKLNYSRHFDYFQCLVLYMCSLFIYYTVSPKGCHQTHGGNFVNSQPIFKILLSLIEIKFSNKIYVLFPTTPCRTTFGNLKVDAIVIRLAASTCTFALFRNHLFGNLIVIRIRFLTPVTVIIQLRSVSTTRVHGPS